VRTLVAVTNSLIGACARRSKPILSARIWRRGLAPPGLRSYGENNRDARSMATKTGEWSSVQRPSSTSSGGRRKGLSSAARDTLRQKRSSATRAPAAPPAA